MAWCNGGSLYTHCQGTAREVKEAASMCEDIVSGLLYLQAQSMVHGNLHWRNVLIEFGHAYGAKGYVCKVGDFGMDSAVGAHVSYITTAVAGPIWHLPPEALNGSSTSWLTPKADVDSLGMLFYLMLMGHAPYDGSVIKLCRQRSGRARHSFSVEAQEVLKSPNNK
eukprot:TRINITY_DN35722_c0_g1_i1.p1 TRINITY_DN35722_c0_g1~~TRINITY_DN35722_c0_g1_i1.p1  ORF type:complete len:166 (+),score=22.17 TRINITY_DN35722_c0_g1_i1:46-543(+)